MACLFLFEKKWSSSRSKGTMIQPGGGLAFKPEMPVKEGNRLIRGGNLPVNSGKAPVKR